MSSLSSEDPRAVAVVAAIQGGDLEALQRLLAEHPDLARTRIVDGRGVGRTLLHVVADWPGHFPNGARTVAILVAAGVDPDARVPGPKGSTETAMHGAASSDDVAVLDALIDGGADLEATGAIFTGGTPMSDAVVFAQWNAARRLLERGATTTVWQAAALGLLDRVQERLAEGSLPDLEVTNALWHACRGGQLEVAQLLVERGGDPRWVGYDGKTPVDAARESGNEGLVAWLVAREPSSPA